MGAAEYNEDGIDMLTTCIMQFEDGARESFNCGMNLEKEMSRRFDRLYVHGFKGIFYQKCQDDGYDVRSDRILK